MTQEEKQLLLKDLCARVPYGIIASVRGSDEEFQHFHILGVKYGKVLVENDILQVDDFEDVEVVKPYLRSISSMTEEEFELLKQYSGLKYDQLDLAEFPNNHKCLDFYLSEIPSYTVILVFDWLNAHHFDYRSLILMGLALEAPEGMYK